MRVVGAWTRACPGAWGRVTSPKIILKICRRSWCRVGYCGIFIYPNWAPYEKLFRIVGYVHEINVFIVVLHIGDTYSEDERIQGRHGGYDHSTYQWVGSYFLYLPIYYWFSQKLNLYESMFSNAMHAYYELYELIFDAYIYVNWCCGRTGKYQVSFMLFMWIIDDVNCVESS